MSDKIDPKYTQNVINELTGSLKLDLIAIFKLIEYDITKLLYECGKDNLYLDEFISKMEELI